MKKEILLIAPATFFFSTMEIALKLTAGSFNAIQLTFLRFLIGSLVLLPPALRQLRLKKTKLVPRDAAFFLLTGFLCVDVSMILYQMAVLYSPASVVAVLFSCNSVFLVLLAVPMFGEKLRLKTVVSIALSLLGMAVMIDPFHFAGSPAGTLLTLSAAAAFALYNAVGRTRSERYGGVALTSLSFLFGCAELLLLIAASHLAPVADLLGGAGLGLFARVPVFSGIALSTLPALAYVGVFVTGCGFAFYFLAMETGGAAKAALVFFFKPVLAPLLALAVLGETITPQMAGGIALIVVGSLASFVPDAAFLRRRADDRERAE